MHSITYAAGFQYDESLRRSQEVIGGLEFSARAHDSYPTFSFVMMMPAAPLRL